MEILKKLLLTFIFVFGISFISTNFGETHESQNLRLRVINIKKSSFDVNKAIYALKTESLYLKRDLKTLDSLTYNLLDNFIEDSVYDTYNLSKKDLISCIQALSMFESGIVTKKGSMPFKSSLFVESNNPFGIKHTKDKYHAAMTTEVYNGQKQRKYLKFQYYPTMNEAIDDLLRIFDLKRYDSLHKAKTKKEFFYYLRKSGYHTAGYSYSYALTQYAIKLYDLNSKPV